MSRVGELYRVVKTSDMFTRGSVLRLFYDDHTDIPKFTLVFGSHLPEWASTYKQRGALYENLNRLERIDTEEKI